VKTGPTFTTAQQGKTEKDFTFGARLAETKNALTYS
jgi:hypothetical protein